ncbi:3-hydroxyacyl-CoA dehydrogenase [Kocuria marina]|uniref:3-hydroxyacyl-CoA dehydrogenase n=1 Tax=Kocuria marina TaxID=223184 RepID=A0A0B0D8E2_9MICC|nr:3-hydroxyacyl-CoA dehydrogenase family protein [Kocuria marina]KHE73688.1 3-hydroxyacyl-CoA dehydrogenase [Kocuria marina]
MTTETPKHITVIGAGAMGSQIAMVCALAGYDTDVVDIAQDAVDRAETQLHERMDRDVAKQRRTAEDVAAAFERLTFTTDRDGCAAQADVVIEAAVEDLGIKRKLFAELDRICPEHTILVTNSSNIVSSRVADATGRPEKVCNFHFFNPALVMQCVEVVPHVGTSRKTVDTALELARSLGKQPVELKKEVPGFVANRLLGALRTEALKLYEDGVADFEDIDIAAKTALRHPMGPFELMDLVGIDVVHLIRLAEYEQTGDPASLPARSIREKYEAGEYGRKTGKGWYDYS